MRTSSSLRCTWMRAPSSFHSTDASPTSASAAPTSGARPRASAARRARPRARLAQPAGTLGERDHGDAAEVARQHRGPAHERRGHRRGARDGIGHHAVERALAQLADEQAADEVGLRRRRPVEQRRAGSLPAGADPLPVVTRIRSRARSTSAIVSVGTAAGVHVEPEQRGPADADPALARLAGEEPDRRLDLVGREAGRAARRARRPWSSAPASTRPRPRSRPDPPATPRQCARRRSFPQPIKDGSTARR